MQIIDDRRALHRIPELVRDLPETMAYLRRALEGLRCELFTPIESSLCAWFDFGRDHAIAFRSDADALPITERTNAPYASRHPGRMHACGHDGHMAMLLELARRLNEKETLPHNVLLIFQCAEETTAGARDICATDIFRRYHVEAIFGMHLSPGLTKGVVASRENEMMARASEIDVDVHGRSAHVAHASDGLDALAAGTEFYRRATAMEAAMPDNIYRLLKFGLFTSGTVRNALSCLTHIEGSMRAFQDEVFYSMRDKIVSIARDVERETGCSIDIHIDEGYPAVINPPALCERVRRTVDYVELDKPAMTAEDFAFYQRVIPGMFFFLGVGDVPALHSDNFDFDENVLVTGADFWEKLAEEFR